MRITSYPASNRYKLDISPVSIFFDTYVNESHGAVSLYRDKVLVASLVSPAWSQFSRAMDNAKVSKAVQQ